MNNLADLYTEYVVKLDPVLWEMGRVNGIGVDNEQRLQVLSEMDGKLKEMRDEAQKSIPSDLFPTKRYKNPISDETLLNLEATAIREVKVSNNKVKTCEQCRTQHVTKGEHTSKKGGKGDVQLNPCYKANIILTPGIDIEYDAVLPFNPGSDEQLKEYAGHFRHRLGRNWHTGADTLDAKRLQKFIDKYGNSHPIYAIVSQLRKVRKARGYANAWVPDAKGLIYGKFGHTPETFRLSQKEHNFMNVSHRGDVPYVDELRSILIAPEGHLIVEADSSSIEAVYTGYFMGSKEYMALAGKGIHGWWAAKKLGMDPTPKNIDFIKNAKEHQVLYETKKRTVHGVSYGMGAKLLHESYPELFPVIIAPDPKTGRMVRCPTCTAQAEIEEFYGLVPDLKQWHTDTQKFAHKHGYLQSPWGFRNYYYRVFAYDWEKKVWKPGEDAKAAIAFLPQHSNGMFQRMNLRLIHEQIEKRGKKGVWWQPAIGHIHDSNSVIGPEDDRDKIADMLAEVMCRKVKELGGLQVGVTVKAGRRWSEMKTVK